METYMGPAPMVPIRSQVKRPARVMVRNLRCPPGATSRSRVFQFQVLSSRRRWRPGVTGMVTVPPYMSSATGLLSSFTMIWRSWISLGEVRRMMICASGACAEAEDIAGAQNTAEIHFVSYFLKRSSKAWRASLWRGGGGGEAGGPLSPQGGGAGVFSTVVGTLSKFQGLLGVL